MARGYFAIGIENNKTPSNLGTLWRSAYTFGAAYIFTIHRRYPPQASDTVKAWRHVPLFSFETLADCVKALPRECLLIGIEQCDRAKDLETFYHPERAVYLLGAEDSRLSAQAQGMCHHIIAIQSRLCLNVAVAGSIVMYHRQSQVDNVRRT